MNPYPAPAKPSLTALRGLSGLSATTSRRAFTTKLLKTAAAILAAPSAVSRSCGAPAILAAARPAITHGVASGDVSLDSAIIWSRTDRASRMIVEWSTSDSFRERRRVVGQVTDAKSDFTSKIELKRLPPGQRVFYRVQFEDRYDAASEPVMGQFTTAANDERDVFFAWSGDTCGQSYGIDESRGGLRTYEAMRSVHPDFFIHS